MRYVAIAIPTAIAVLLSLLTGGVCAQSWPSRSITMVVPFAAGGSADIVARGLADHLSEALGQSVVIDNKGGAGGNVGAATVAKAQPDGYMLLLATTGPAATNTLMYKNLTFDSQRDLAPVVLIAKSPVIIVARPGAAIKSLPELIAYAKANPGKLTAGFPGLGTLGQITGELLRQRAGADMTQVQYRGGSAIINDLIGGHVDIGMDSMAPYVPHIREGTLKALAIAGAKRWPELPDVPTVAEAGLPGFEATVWYCLLAPAGTPAEAVDRINAAANAYLKTIRAKELFTTLNMETAGGSPADLKSFIGAEIEKWGPIVKAANITF